MEYPAGGGRALEKNKKTDATVFNSKLLKTPPLIIREGV